MAKRKRSSSKSRTAKTHVGKGGYRMFKDSGIPVHRWTAENKLGRRLKAGEVVHHKNRNKLDNSSANLAVFGSQGAHWKAHTQDAQKHGWKYSLIGK